MHAFIHVLQKDIVSRSRSLRLNWWGTAANVHHPTGVRDTVSLCSRGSWVTECMRSLCPLPLGDCSQQGMKVHLALWKTFNVSKTGGVHQRVPGPGSWRLRGADAPDGNTCPCSVTSSLRRDNASHSRCSSSPLRFIFEICWSEGSGRIRGCRYTFFLLKGWCPKVNLMS